MEFLKLYETKPARLHLKEVVGTQVFSVKRVGSMTLSKVSLDVPEVAATRVPCPDTFKRQLVDGRFTFYSIMVPYLNTPVHRGNLVWHHLGKEACPVIVAAERLRTLPVVVWTPSQTDQVLASRQNPFHGKCVVIDDIHVVVGMILSNPKNKLYDWLMEAKDCRIVGLTGMPARQPEELVVLFNILRGYVEGVKPVALDDTFESRVKGLTYYLETGVVPPLVEHPLSDLKVGNDRELVVGHSLKRMEKLLDGFEPLDVNNITRSNKPRYLTTHENVFNHQWDTMPPALAAQLKQLKINLFVSDGRPRVDASAVHVVTPVEQAELEDMILCAREPSVAHVYFKPSPMVWLDRLHRVVLKVRERSKTSPVFYFERGSPHVVYKSEVGGAPVGFFSGTTFFDNDMTPMQKDRFMSRIQRTPVKVNGEIAYMESTHNVQAIFKHEFDRTPMYYKRPGDGR